MDIKTNNSNGLCYKELDGLKLGDVFEYISDRGMINHYVVSFLFKAMNISMATIIFPDGFAETIKTEQIKKDKYINNIGKWINIYNAYIDEACRYK